MLQERICLYIFLFKLDSSHEFRVNNKTFYFILVLQFSIYPNWQLTRFLLILHIFINDVCNQVPLQMWIKYIEIFGVAKVLSIFFFFFLVLSKKKFRRRGCYPYTRARASQTYRSSTKRELLTARLKSKPYWVKCQNLTNSTNPSLVKFLAFSFQ